MVRSASDQTTSDRVRDRPPYPVCFYPHPMKHAHLHRVGRFWLPGCLLALVLLAVPQAVTAQSVYFTWPPYTTRPGWLPSDMIHQSGWSVSGVFEKQPDGTWDCWLYKRQSSAPYEVRTNFAGQVTGLPGAPIINGSGVGNAGGVVPCTPSYAAGGGPILYQAQLESGMSGVFQFYWPTDIPVQTESPPVTPVDHEVPDRPDLLEDVGYTIVGTLEPYSSIQVAWGELVLLARTWLPPTTPGWHNPGTLNMSFESIAASPAAAFTTIETTYSSSLTVTRIILGASLVLGLYSWSAAWLAWGLGMRQPENVAKVNPVGDLL